MDHPRIQKLLTPFLPEPLTENQLNDISIYIDLLLRWNARLNLTAVCDEENIVTRHFGESFFAAQHLFSANDQRPGVACPEPSEGTNDHVTDVGSGAGFPGLPIKIFAPDVKITLIESNHKKATFLREVIRALHLTDAEVFIGRASTFPASSANLVTLRAVERFEAILPEAARLLAPRSTLALLIGRPQTTRASQVLPSLSWRKPIPLPLSQSRTLLIGSLPESRI